MSGYIFIFRFGDGIGDQLCMVALAEALNKQTGEKVIVFTDYVGLFKNNPHLEKVVEVNRETVTGGALFRALHRLEGNRVLHFSYKKKDNLDLESYMRKTQAKISLIELHSLHISFPIDHSSLSPILYFENAEEEQFLDRVKEYGKYAIINPISKKQYTPNKDWGFDNFQKVVDLTKNDIQWIQVGLENERLLNHVSDMRGKTSSLRELALWIKFSEFVLSNEGMYNHMAAAVSTRSYTLFGGFHPKEVALYDTTIPLVQKQLPECAYCWLRSPCPYDHLRCFEGLGAEDVAEKILNNEKLRK
ncbi:glycosyltransferase family 9 protein [Hydrogenimonas cancrithermarum]|nr:glycosyltransferase family 9 protein [Hydrogenimonas cancrithermarum]